MKERNCAEGMRITGCKAGMRNGGGYGEGTKLKVEHNKGINKGMKSNVFVRQFT